MNFYFTAAQTLDRLDQKQGSIKGVLSTLPEKDRKRTAALVIETLKYRTVLAEVIAAASLLKQERKITSLSLALVLVHDLLLGGGIQAGDGPVKQAILRHKTRLNGELQKVKIKRGVHSNAELAQTGDLRAERIPRYVRVNTLVWPTDEAVQAFISEGCQLTDPFETENGFARDPHIPDLLAFSPRRQFGDDVLLREGKIILQDKASCFPAAVLAPPSKEDSVVIDATAAPGNKTSHLSALMGNRGKLLAFERDKKRFGTLKSMLARARCTNVEAINADFLSVQPEDGRYAAVTHILLDPSCSGSGIVNRMDHLLESVEESDDTVLTRLNKLSAFQLTMIRHAMKFPAAIKIVYSTCSVHAVENEHVVRAALNSEEARVGGFKLAPPELVLPQWPRRGLSAEMDSPADAACLVRCSPGEDATNGFFVSCFVKETTGTSSIDPLSTRKRKGEEGLSGDKQAAGAAKKKKKRKRSNAG